MANVSTNALTAKWCKNRGFPADTVQSWRGRARHDLFHIADTVAFIAGKQVWIQNCSHGTLKKHRDEINENPILHHIRENGIALELWEWRKEVGKRRWWLRVQEYEHETGTWKEVEIWQGPYNHFA